MAAPSLLTPIALREFGTDSIADVPATSGVYVLFRRGTVLVVGMSTDIRATLVAGLQGRGGARAKHSTHYRYETAPLSALDDLQETLLHEYRTSHNYTVPFGNRQDVTRRSQVIREPAL